MVLIIASDLLSSFIFQFEHQTKLGIKLAHKVKNIIWKKVAGTLIVHVFVLVTGMTLATFSFR